ncbi:MAG TPA: EamA family transporter [Clostridiales bacterium]|nr:EamA family transporter [Clostridiales bacterium]
MPVVLIVGSNALYHICSKEINQKLNPMLALMATYIVAFVVTFILYLLIGHPAKAELAEQIKLINWAPLALGLFVVGLEAGFIYLYRVGWDISIGSLVCNILLAIVLIGIGVLLYKEQISRQQLLGIVLCVAGLIFVNKK